MKRRIYDFAKAIKVADEWYKPSELSARLKNVALLWGALDDNNTGAVSKMQSTVLDVCDFLDAIEEKEVEQ